MKELKVKITDRIKKLFWRDYYPQNIEVFPIVVDHKNKYFLNPIAGEFINTDQSMYPLEPEYQINSTIQTCCGPSYFYAIPISLEKDKFEICEEEFFLQISFISSFIIVEYEVILDKSSHISITWIFQLLKEIISDLKY